MKQRIQCILLALLAPVAAAQGTLPRKTLSLEGARAVTSAAEAYAKQNGAGAAIAVVDEGGNLLSFARLDGTFAAGAGVSIGKARTAALFQRPTAFFEQVIVEKGRVSMTALPDFTPLQGGVPIVVDGQIVGAVGVSGAKSAQQDTEIAEAAAAVVQQMERSGAQALETAFFEKDVVAAAFQRGAPLLETEDFKIHASRRDAAGEAEVHGRDTDILYVTGGEALLVTGGTVVEAREIGPEELRGSSIRGGEERRLVAGDVMVVPAGTPHWFRDVRAPFTYYVVKAR